MKPFCGRSHPRFPLPLAALALLVAGCLENEEELEVRPDGSVHAVVSTAGDFLDLADGYPVPLEVPWRLASEDAEGWVRAIGPATGGADVLRRALATPSDEREDEEYELTVERTFPSVAALPRWYAPAGEPYRTAFLERETRLDVRRVDGRTVYVFERTYRVPHTPGLDVLGRVEERLPQELHAKFDDEDAAITPGDWALVARELQAAHAELAETHVRRAALGLYTEGDAELPPRALDEAVAELAARIEGHLTAARIEAWHAAVEAGDEEAYEAVDSWLRDATRDVLGAMLVREGVEEPQRNAVSFALEHGFTAADHVADLADEELRLVVHLPGTIVGGNAEETDGGTARWGFEGHVLRDHDVVLRAVSVVE